MANGKSVESSSGGETVAITHAASAAPDMDDA